MEHLIDCKLSWKWPTSWHCMFYCLYKFLDGNIASEYSSSILLLCFSAGNWTYNVGVTVVWVCIDTCTCNILWRIELVILSISQVVKPVGMRVSITNQSGWRVRRYLSVMPFCNLSLHILYMFNEGCFCWDSQCYVHYVYSYMYKVKVYRMQNWFACKSCGTCMLHQKRYLNLILRLG